MITIPKHTVLGVYINNSAVAVVSNPVTVDKILQAVCEELAADEVTPLFPIEIKQFGWDTKYDFEVKIDNGEDDEDNRRTETVELMPIVCY